MRLSVVPTAAILPLRNAALLVDQLDTLHEVGEHDAFPVGCPSNRFLDVWYAGVCHLGIHGVSLLVGQIQRDVAAVCVVSVIAVPRFP